MVLDDVIRVTKVTKQTREGYVIVLLNGVGEEVWTSPELDNQSVVTHLTEIGLPAKVVAEKLREAESDSDDGVPA